jgi:hypothetical protein
LHSLLVLAIIVSEVQEGTMATDYQNPFGNEMARFREHMESLVFAADIATNVLSGVHSISVLKLQKFIQDHGITSKSISGDRIEFDVPLGLKSPFASIAAPCERTEIAQKITQRSLVAALVSEYETFLARILRLVLLARPECCLSFKKTTDTADVFACDTLDELRTLIVDREVDSFLYLSCDQQIKWVEDNLHVPLRGTLDFLSNLAEILARRNLYMHADGIVNERYLSTCKIAQFPIDPTVCLGNELPVGPGYYRNACQTLLLVGEEIGVSVWKHSFPDETETATNILTVALLLDPIAQGELDFAQYYGEYLLRTEPMDASNDASVFIGINTAQAYKWAGKVDACRKILNGIDWHKASTKAQLGRCVLMDETQEAGRLMEQIPSCPDGIEAVSYRDWPIFREFRKSSEFLKSFERVFGMKYADFVSNPSTDKPSPPDNPGSQN